MTEVVTFSGVHGAGKTTVINKVAQKLARAGYNVFTLPEFPYIPDIEIGTMVFQTWYRKQMVYRTLVIQNIVDAEIYDIILVDRHPLDVEVYTQLLHHPDVKVTDLVSAIPEIHSFGEKHYFSNVITHYKYLINFVLERDIHDLMESIDKRTDEEEHRKQWENEHDEWYAKKIINYFRIWRSNDNVILINNEVLYDTVQQVFDEITQMM